MGLSAASTLSINQVTGPAQIEEKGTVPGHGFRELRSTGGHQWNRLYFLLLRKERPWEEQVGNVGEHHGFNLGSVRSEVSIHQSSKEGT